MRLGNSEGFTANGTVLSHQPCAPLHVSSSSFHAAFHSSGSTYHYGRIFNMATLTRNISRVMKLGQKRSFDCYLILRCSRLVPSRARGRRTIERARRHCLQHLQIELQYAVTCAHHSHEKGLLDSPRCSVQERDCQGHNRLASEPLGTIFGLPHWSTTYVGSPGIQSVPDHVAYEEGV
jgi:hypothetical protein